MRISKAESDKDSDSDSCFVALGDFNVIDKEHDTMKALTTNGFEVSEVVLQIPEGSNVDRSEAYDQIAYWTDPEGKGFSKDSVTRIEVHRAGVFDFFKTVFRDGDDDPDGKDEKHYRSVYEKFDGFKDTWKYRDWRIPSKCLTTCRCGSSCESTSATSISNASATRNDRTMPQAVNA